MKVDTHPLLEDKDFITTKSYAYPDFPWDSKMKEVVKTLEQLTSELQALHQRVIDLEKTETGRARIEKMTADAYGLPTGPES